MQLQKIYEEVERNTTPKLSLVIMCYEKIIELLDKAAECMQKKEYDKKSEALSRAIDIITELMGALDFKRGKQIAYGLNSIYLYSLNSIIEADSDNRADLLEHVKKLFGEIKEAWVQISKKGVKSV
jgi:flagellar protein FliS